MNEIEPMNLQMSREMEIVDTEKDEKEEDPAELFYWLNFHGNRRYGKTNRKEKI